MPLDLSNPLSGITQQVIGVAIAVHRELGPGLLESAYQACLEYELLKQKIRFTRHQEIPVVYGGNLVECGYRADFIVEGKVIVEVKSVEMIARIHVAQLLTYLKLAGLRTGLLLNFNVTSLRQGIRRVDRRDDNLVIRTGEDREFNDVL